MGSSTQRGQWRSLAHARRADHSFAHREEPACGRSAAADDRRQGLGVPPGPTGAVCTRCLLGEWS